MREDGKILLNNSQKHRSSGCKLYWTVFLSCPNVGSDEPSGSVIRQYVICGNH
jgi:hypothetical protein